MTSHTGRLYALAFALVAFFLSWAIVAARPWAAAAPDKRLQAIAARELQLRQDARLVNAIVAQRDAVYRSQLRARMAQIAAAKARLATARAAATAPSTVTALPAVASATRPVRVVTLPPLTITRTS